MVLVLTLFAALLLAGTPLAATPGRPTAKAPKSAISATQPTFKWSKAAGASRRQRRRQSGVDLTNPSRRIDRRGAALTVSTNGTTTSGMA